MMPTNSNPPELSNSSGGTTSEVCQPQARTQQIQTINGPLAIFWDFENCPIPSDVRAEDVAGNIRMALRVHPVIKGAVTTFSAYGDFNSFPRRLREGCQRTGVKLIDVPHGRKDAADKAILIDMFLFALDNPPPSSILLISGDVDFAPALHVLGQRGYSIILVIPTGMGVSSALSSAGRFVWDWPTVAHGEGFVPAKTLMSRGPDVIDNNLDPQNEEETFASNGNGECEQFAQMCLFNSGQVSKDSLGCSLSEYSNNTFPVPCFLNSRTQSLPSCLNDVSGEQNEGQDQTLWAQPGDVQGLKGQMVRMLELSGGSLPLVRVPAEYNKMFGRPLYMLEYGECKLVNLMKKMSDVLTVEKKGKKKLVCLRMAIDRRVNHQDERNTGLVREASSEADEHLEQFRRELQELLVIYGHKIPLDLFKAIYEQRYKKTLDHQSLGVNELEDFFEKLKDVVTLFQDTNMKKIFITAK
ncbi:uncharacterized protein [Aristolochia californica]|uniref:uncharacterized protein n=1 Tax=Aristolochia californica TaxID=171875 RepID=UPI0035DAC983